MFGSIGKPTEFDTLKTRMGLQNKGRPQEFGNPAASGIRYLPTFADKKMGSNLTINTVSSIVTCGLLSCKTLPYPCPIKKIFTGVGTFYNLGYHIEYDMKGFSARVVKQTQKWGKS